MKKYKAFTDVTVVTVDSKEYINKIIPVCSFPFDVFPDKFQKVVKKEGVVLSVEPEVVANIKLTVLSGAIGNSIRISPKPEHKVSPFIWSGIVAESGYGKSHPINASMEPVETRQAEEYKRYQDELHKHNSQQSKTQSTSGKKAKPRTYSKSKPVFKQLKVSDTTTEALADVFENQPRGVILHRDELSGLILGLNQYKGSKGSDKQNYIELFDAKPMTINRKMTGHKYIPNTGAAIIGGISPRILPVIFTTDNLDDGFLPRFLTLHVENKPIIYNTESLDFKDKHYWEGLVDFCYGITLVLDNNDRVEPKILTLNNAALKVWVPFYNEYNQIAAYLPVRIRGFIPKLITYSLKFAGILHILKSFEKGTIDNEIDEDTVHGAIKLTRFYAGQAVKLVQLYDTQKDELPEHLKRIIKVLYELRDRVKRGVLPLSEIVKAYNDSLHDNLQFSPEKISNILNDELGLNTKKCGRNLSHLIWEQEKIQKLFKQTVTTVTTVTDSDAHKKDVKPKIEPNNDGQGDMQETIENDLMEVEI